MVHVQRIAESGPPMVVIEPVSPRSFRRHKTYRQVHVPDLQLPDSVTNLAIAFKHFVNSFSRNLAESGRVLWTPKTNLCICLLQEGEEGSPSSSILSLRYIRQIAPAEIVCFKHPMRDSPGFLYFQGQRAGIIQCVLEREDRYLLVCLHMETFIDNFRSDLFHRFCTDNLLRNGHSNIKTSIS